MTPSTAKSHHQQLWKVELCNSAGLLALCRFDAPQRIIYHSQHLGVSSSSQKLCDDQVELLNSALVHAGPVISLAFTTDSAQLFTTSLDGTVFGLALEGLQEDSGSQPPPAVTSLEVKMFHSRVIVANHFSLATCTSTLFMPERNPRLLRGGYLALHFFCRRVIVAFLYHLSGTGGQKGGEGQESEIHSHVPGVAAVETRDERGDTK